MKNAHPIFSQKPPFNMGRPIRPLEWELPLPSPEGAI